MSEVRATRRRTLLVGVFLVATASLGFVLYSEGFYDGISPDFAVALGLIGGVVFLVRDLRRFWKRRHE